MNENTPALIVGAIVAVIMGTGLFFTLVIPFIKWYIIENCGVSYRPVRPKGSRDWYVDFIYKGVRLKRKRAWSELTGESSYEAAQGYITEQLTRRADQGYKGSMVAARSFVPLADEEDLYLTFMLQYGYPTPTARFPIDEVKEKLQVCEGRVFTEAETRIFILRYYQWAQIHRTEQELLEKQLLDMKAKDGIFKPMEKF